MHVDPICKMEVDPAEAITIEHEGEIVYFCSEGCRDVFINGHSKQPKRSFEMIIIGGGPAGLTAAVYAATLKIDAFVITHDLGGQAIDSTKIKNYMGFDFITGPELTQKFKEQLIHSNYIAHLVGEVEKIATNETGFTVRMADGETYFAKAVLVATGMKRRQLGVPGEEEFQRKGVFYGNIQDVTQMEGKDAVVIGGGNSAMQISENLSTVAQTVHIVTDLPLKVTADAKDIDRLLNRRNVCVHEECRVAEIAGDETVNQIRIKQLGTDESTTLPASGAFIAIGLQPNSSLATGLVELNNRGEVKIGADCSTSTPGLFAAGDVTDAYGKRIIIAAGEGAKAALAVRQYLLNRKREEKAVQT